MDLPPDVQQALQTWAHLTCTLAGVVDFLRERMAASGVRSRNDFAPYRQGAADAMMAGGDMGPMFTCDHYLPQSVEASSFDKNRGRRLVYKLERDLFPDDINCHVCSIATSRLPYRAADRAECSASSEMESLPSVLSNSALVTNATRSPVSFSLAALEYRRAGITLHSIPDEVMVDMLHSYLRGQLLELRCVSRRWDSLVVRVMSLNSSSLVANHLPPVVPPGYGGIMELDLSGWGQVGHGEVFALLMKTVLFNDSITSLLLDGVLTALDGMRTLVEALRINSSVTLLSLRTNRIGDAGAKILSDALALNTSITDIKLSNNDISDGGALALAALLRVNTRISRLWLGQNLISNVGTVGLCEALRVNTTLTYLDLSSNQIGDVGAVSVGRLLRVNTSITSLLLSNNLFSNEGVLVLIRALCENSTLTFLQLRLETGDEYEGGWLRNERHGQGTCRFTDGCVYEGMWVKDVRSGRGILRYTNGSVYEGDWEDDCHQGQGTLTFSSGNIYQGAWKNSTMQGQGTHRFADGSVYEGAWENNKRHGQGKYLNLDSAEYEGAWKDDKRHGQGKFIFPNRSVFIGSFAAGSFVDGIFRFADSDEEYDAVFERREDKEVDCWHVYWAVLRDTSEGGAVHREGFFSKGAFMDDSIQ